MSIGIQNPKSVIILKLFYNRSKVCLKTNVNGRHFNFTSYESAYFRHCALCSSSIDEQLCSNSIPRGNHIWLYYLNIRKPGHWCRQCRHINLNDSWPKKVTSGSWEDKGKKWWLGSRLKVMRHFHLQKHEHNLLMKEMFQLSYFV
jgi:hypothetical protein